jgi:phospholipase C
MFENRSFDNLCGWLYADDVQPKVFLPEGSPEIYDGLKSDFSNPSSFTPPMQPIPVTKGTTSSTVPNPDPEETFDNVTEQLYGPDGPTPTPRFPMRGFVVNYEKTKSGDPNQIMQTYMPEQLPVMSALARNYAISDAWFCSVPSQTWPNRAFVHAGTSNGNINNGEVPDPLCWEVDTIFNVLRQTGNSWSVYSDAPIIEPSLTRTMFPKLWSPFLDGHFQRFNAFQHACATNSLPQYSFVEPAFLQNANDAHPPHSMTASEQFLHDIWTAVSTSAAWPNMLLIITFDEHGGCIDHVLPPLGATSPDRASDPGHENFHFDRFGVRVPTVLVSPYIQAGTVFRSNTNTPYDHTSILATLRDWLAIPATQMLPSARIKAAPTVAQVLRLTSPRTDVPVIARPAAVAAAAPLSLEMNDLQKSIVTGMAVSAGMDPHAVLPAIKTRQDAVNFFAGQARPAAAAQAR